MKIQTLEHSIEDMRKKLLQINRNPFLPDRLKMDKMREIDKQIQETEITRNTYIKTIMQKGS